MPLFLFLRPAYKGGKKVAALSLSFPSKLRFYIKEEGMSGGGREISTFLLYSVSQ